MVDRLPARGGRERTNDIDLATASTAGLASYLLSLDPDDDIDLGSPQALRDYIVYLAYPRGDEESIKAIWNNVSPPSSGNNGPVCTQVSNPLLSQWP